MKYYVAMPEAKNTNNANIFYINQFATARASSRSEAVDNIADRMMTEDFPGFTGFVIVKEYHKNLFGSKLVKTEKARISY